MAAETRTFQGVTYTNGSCPKSILAPLDGDNWGTEPAYLRKDAAASYNRARAEVLAKTGIVLRVRGWNRTLAEQEQFFHERYERGRASADQRYHVHAGVGAWYGLKPGHAAAAIPGDSNHGWAIAIDVDDFGSVGNFNHPRRVAAIAILKRHGWTDDEGRGRIQEPWHLVYDPARDQHRNDKPVQEDELSAEAESNIKKILEILTAPITDTINGVEKRVSLATAEDRSLSLARRNETLIRRVLAAVLTGQPITIDAAGARLIAEAIPDELAQDVADVLAARLAK